MQDALEQSERFEANQGESHLLLVRSRSSDEHRLDEFVEGRLLDQQQMLDDGLLDHVQLDLDRLRAESLLQ